MTIQTTVEQSKRKFSITLLLTCILFSLITGFSVASIIITDGNLETFYNRGDFLPFYADKFEKHATNLTYDSSTQIYTVATDGAIFTLDSLNKEQHWNYLTLHLSNMNTPTLDIQLNYLDRNGNLIGTNLFSLKNGVSTIMINSEAFSCAILYILSPVGTTFTINDFEFSTNAPADNSRIFSYGLIGSLVCLIVTLLLTSLFLKKGKIPNWYAPINGLQTIYIAMGTFFFSLLPPLSPRFKKNLRIGILTGMFCILSFINVYGYFFDESVQPWLMLLISISLLFVGTLSMKSHELTYINWKNPLVASWFFLWTLSCISDFFVTKKSPYFSGYGYFMLFIMGFLFFSWNQLKDHTQILQELCKVIECTFILCAIYCVLCRPDTAGFRYKGFYNNPNPFGLYLAIVACIFLCELDRFIKNQEFNLLKLTAYACGLVGALFFLKKTQCTTGTLAIVATIVLWMLNKLFTHPTKERKYFFQAILIVALCYYPVSLGLQWGITTVPHIFNTEVVYPADQDFAYIDHEFLAPETIVYASDIMADTPDSSNRILDKLTNSSSLNTLLSGRLYHYSTYIRNMNLFGHSKRSLVYGSNINYPHNGFLAYPHTYGVYVLIPYVLMYLHYFIQAVHYLWSTQKKNSFAFLPLSIFIVFFLENMMDNVDTPFHWVVWFIFVFIGGVLFPASLHSIQKSV